MDQRITSAGLLTPASNTPAQSVGSGTPNASPPNIPLTPATTASLDNNLSTNVSASSSIPDPEGLGVLNPNDESNNEQSTGFLPIQSCYCVVCLKCFFCGKVKKKKKNVNHCTLSSFSSEFILSPIISFSTLIVCVKTHLFLVFRKLNQKIPN